MKNQDWICTFTGRHHYINDPRPETVCVEDIAHGLSLICRFGGQCRHFYSVGEHSIHVAHWLERKFPNDHKLHLLGLGHDMSEGLGLVDLPRPMKEQLPDYKDLEHRTMVAIYQGLGIDFPTPEQEILIKTADNTLLATERRDLVNHGGHAWSIEEQADPEIDVSLPWKSDFVEQYFLQEYARLRNKCEKTPT